MKSGAVKVKKDKHVWQNHEGMVVESSNDFDVIDCEVCGFKHITPIPTEEELEKAYQHDYYTQEKPLYLERHKEDIDWWNLAYAERYELMEQFLPETSKLLLDIGSGPGFFLLHGQERGWNVKGIEPSVQAAEHSRELGVSVVNEFFSEESAAKLEKFDVIHMSDVLEHIPDPAKLLEMVHEQLNEEGLVAIVVPNDFNPFQLALRDHLDFKPWWVAPPHHINYFNFNSLQHLLERSGFEMIHKEATFPIDMFLLMGDNYIGNDDLGRACHGKRKTMELNLSNAGLLDLKRTLYKSFANAGIGREIIMLARKTSQK
jgi:SAM-dependent methyltransferase